jgi:cell division protein FtsI/penicillin-binding protein 2
MKIFTMAAALDAGKVVPSTQFMDYGELLFHGTSIRNWNNKTFGQLTMTTCLQHSSNVCLATVSTEYLGTDIYYNYMKAFGFGRLTNIDLAGERTGVMRLPIDDGWSIIDLATNAFGQGLSATPIQMLTGASAIANGGEMVYPHLVHYKVINGESRLTTPIIANTPISESTAQTLTEMLAISLEQEASTALVPGYRIAGKTGTAQIPTEFGWYDFNETNASFIGWGPIDDPQFMVYIWLERPKSSIWASVVAAPVFNEMVQRLVVLLEIPPDNIRHLAAGR